MTVLETARLRLREFTLADSPAVLELLNEPGFLRYIGDRGIRDLAGAEKYLRDGPLTSYPQHGFGLWCVALRDTGEVIGTCGLLRRPILPDADLGYAFFARHGGHGYALEAATACVEHARQRLRFPRLLAITALENPRSIALLGKLGFQFRETQLFPGFTAPSRVFALEFSAPEPGR